jgi:hypothetical protein
MIELARRCEAGIGRRYPGITGKAHEKMRSRLEHELRIIATLGFASYFLTVAEVSKMILDMGVRVAARGVQEHQAWLTTSLTSARWIRSVTTSFSSASSQAIGPPCRTLT